MSENKIQKRLPNALKEKTQYALTFGVIATMLLVAGFPTFVIAFFGIFAYFLWKTFISPPSNSIKEVFEFYLSTNEILRNEERRWFGFEIQEVILNGEIILQRMNGAPPLVYFSLGALYNKIGNHKAAVNHLSYIMENEAADESNYHYATPELKEYVRILREIEREPTKAPQTSAAIRALERTRRNRGKTLLEESRMVLDDLKIKQLDNADETAGKNETVSKSLFSTEPETSRDETSGPDQKPEFLLSDYAKIVADKLGDARKENHRKKNKKDSDQFSDRKPITEVLHDIYDKN